MFKKYYPTAYRSKTIAHPKPVVTNADKGRFAENFVVDILRDRGYTIEAQNFKLSYNEVDIICSKNDCFHFIEVKYRRSLKEAHEAIRSSQILRISQVAEEYMRANKDSLWQIDFFLLDNMYHLQEIRNIWVDL